MLHLVYFASMALSVAVPADPIPPDRRPNVLLIAIDDLNDWVGVLGGHPQARTPHLDALAARGTLFANAHCQAPVCTPSRASLFTGRHPSATGMYFLQPTLSEEPTLRATVTLVERFRRAGYETLGVGKIHHGDERPFFERYLGGMGGFGPRPERKISHPQGHPLWDWGAYPERDADMPDYLVADQAIAQLEASHERPFFLAVGFWRPHVPMYAPKPWFDRHPLDAVALPQVSADDRNDLPEYAKLLTIGLPAPRHAWFVANEQWRHAVQSYLACSSFVDAQVGRVLDALERSPHAEDTIVVVFSDHGFHLGEKERWAKRSLWEDATRVPLIVATPNGTPGTCREPVGLIDVFPTLCDLCGIEPDAALQGHSLVPQLRDPEQRSSSPALTTFGPGNHSLRTRRWRYLRYRDGSEELYDHDVDPHEWRNLAEGSEHAGTLSDLRTTLERELRRIAPHGERALLPGAERSSGAEAFHAAEAWRLREGRDAVADDPLFDAFRHPSATARPWLRWWWNGNRITTRDVDRQLDAMAGAGIGGVEINPIALPSEAAEVGADPVEWLSPAWNRLLAHAVQGAHRRGMLADLIVGSGWPFGGRFLERDHQIQTLRVRHVPLPAGRAHRFRWDELVAFPRQRAGADFADDPPTRLAFFVRVPEVAASLADVVDVRDLRTGDGTLVLPAAAEDSFLCVGVVQTGFREVVHGAPGADGPVLDHFDADAVRSYLDRLSNTLGPVLGGRLGDSLRAAFCDSIELGGANWTDDLSTEFERRRGYAVEPWLPLILPDTRGPRWSAPRPSSAFADRVRRARHDFALTIAEVFLERFVDTFCQWCREQGTASRYQAYGTPWLYGMLEGYARPDIPEGDTWIHFPHDVVGPRLDGIRYAVWNKVAASAAHRTGRRIVAAEAMTNLHGVFRATLEDLKQAADLTFVSGVNHSILHGWNHSPREAGFPGWVRYGTYFSDQNPWWSHVRRFTDYHARIAAVLQASEARAQVAILGPRADVWSEHGLDRGPYLGTPPWLFAIWQAFQNVGCVAEYVTEADLRDASTAEGELVCGVARYRLVVLADVETLAPRTAEALLRHVAAGGRVAVVGRLPRRAASMQDGDAGDDRVRAALAAVLDADASHAARVEIPGPDRIAWVDALLKRFAISRPIAILDPDPYLMQVQHRAGEREIFFVTNLDRKRALAPRLRFDSPGKTIWRWDAESGERWKVGRSDVGCTLPFGPLESALLVLEPPERHEAGLDARSVSPPAEEVVTELRGPWRVRLEPLVGEPSARTLEVLGDLATSRDPELATFAGRLEYRMDVDGSLSPGARALDLGTVHGVSEVWLGGRPLGVRWWGRHVYPLHESPGSCELRIRVTTTAANYARTLDDPTARRWTRPWREAGPAPAGLVGPVRLMR